MTNTLIVGGLAYLVMMFTGLFCWAMYKTAKGSPPMSVREKRFLVITWVGAFPLGVLLVVIIQWLFEENSKWAIVINSAVLGTYFGLMLRHLEKLRQENLRRLAETNAAS